MKHMLPTLLLSFLIAMTVKADKMAIQFRVIKTEDILKLHSNDKKIDYSRIPSVAQGYLEKECSIYLKTEDYQYRIKASFTEKKSLLFSLSMYSQKSRNNVFTSSGEVVLSDKFNIPSLKKGWHDDSYVIVWQRVNLKL